MSRKPKDPISVVHVTTAELAETSKLASLRRKTGKGFEQAGRSDTLIGGRGGVAPDPRPVCEAHNIPGCQCLDSPEVVARRAELRVRAEAQASAQRGESADIPVAVPPKKISTRQRRREEKIAAELAAERAAQHSDEALAAEKKKREDSKKMQFHVIQNVRKIYGYDARDLAKFLDRGGFNAMKYTTDLSLLDTNPKFAKLNLEIARKQRKRTPKTMGELLNMLPAKLAPLFSDEEIALYKGVAARNRKAKDPDDFLELENRIIHRAWDLALLPRKRAPRPEDSDRDRDHDYDLETKSGTIGDTTVTAGHTSTGQLKQMNSFDRGPMHAQAPGEDSGQDNGAASDDETDDILD